jgi:phospholipid/cholesterol/gamma-HCH transport system permease protein
MVAGRVGSAMARSTMKITEQVDALQPGAILSAILSSCGRPSSSSPPDLLRRHHRSSAATSNVVLMGVNGTVYLRNTLMYLELWDVLSGTFKAAVFGIIIAIVGCWQGLKAEGGAEGVGRATTRSAVIASISILITNFFLSSLLPGNL